MKNFALIISFFIFLSVNSQRINWTIKWGQEKSFIENKGQFEALYKVPIRDGILFGYESSQETFFFTKNKVIIRLADYKKKNSSEEYEKKEYFERKKKMSPEQYKKHEIEEFRNSIIEEYVTIEWLNTNSDVVIIPENKTSHYHSYTFKINGKLTNINYIPSYEKITYKNIYPNIDVVYEFHPDGGTKYSIYIYPGGKVENIRLKYSHPITKKNNGQVLVKTKLGKIIEHPPITFYSTDKKPILSSYVVNNNVLSFSLVNADYSKTIVIDPWTQTPFSNSSNGVWECETDAAGNAYIIGDGMVAPQKLKKYNTTGALQWTYTTSWDTSGYWLGTLATDNNGNSYITAGSVAQLEKINTSGTMLYHKNGGPMDEYWAIAFNCDQTKLIVGGTRLEGFPVPYGFGVLFDINTNTGDVISIVKVGANRPGAFGMVNDVEEVRSMSAAYNAKYYYLTLDTIAAITQNFSQCPNNEPLFAINHTYKFGYKSEHFRPENGNGANMAIKANKNFVYTQNGVKVDKRSLLNGGIISSVNIPGGGTQTNLGFNAPHNNGIDLDTCGNVYIGSKDRVLKYDANLTQLASSNTTFRVSDVAVGVNGEVIVCGTTGASGANGRVGYVQSVAFSACPKQVMQCCDANICPVELMCLTDPPITLIGGTSGGTWSGNGITNSTTGTFNPSVAGVGSHTIYYTLPCGVDSIIITVIDCSQNISVCYDGTSLQGTGGAGVLQWQTQQTQIIQPQNQTQCQQCGGTWFFGVCSVPICSLTTWVTYTTGNTASVPSSWPLQVTDGTNTVTYNSLSQIPPCSGCTNPTIQSNVTHVTCAGLNNGAIDITVTGSSTYNYNWTGPNNFTANTQDINNLAPGTYNVTVTDANNATCTATATIVVNPGSPNPSPNITGSTTFCVGGYTTLDAGTGYSSYLWSNGQTTQTINVSSPGPYSVTVTNNNGCTGTASVVVSQASNLSPTITGTLAICSGNSTILDAGPGYSSYNWSNGQTTQTITVTQAGNYSVTVSDASGCTGTAQASVVVSQNPTPSITGNTTICAGTSTTLDAGSGYQSYLWSNNSQTQTINVTTAGTYSVTVTNSSGCTGSASVNVQVVPLPNPNAGIDNSTCGLTYNLNAISSTSGVWTGYGPGTVAFSNNTNPQSVVSVSNQGIYTFVWTETVGGSCSASDTVVITFLLTPTSTFTATTIECAGGSTTVTYTGNASSNATFNWNWGGGNAIPGTGSGPHQVSWANSGTYIITLTVTENGCTSNPTSVQVIHPDGMNVSITSNNILCNGQNTGAINLTVTGGTTPYYYQWNNGANIEDLLNIPAGFYSVTVTDANGCTKVASTNITEPNQITIAITPSHTICYGQSTTLLITATGGTPPYTYYWNQQPSNAQITVTPLSTITYTAHVVDANGCISNTVNTTIYVSSPVVVNLIAQPTQICPGEVVLLTPIVHGGTGAPYTITYQNGDIVTPPYYIYPSYSGYYWIKAEDACGSWDSAGVFITVLPLPPADALADTVQGCEPLTVQFIEINPDSGRTFVWNFGDNSNLSLAKNPIHTYTSPGVYDVTLTVTSPNGCKTINVYNNMITVWPKPNAKFTWEPEIASEVKPIIQFYNYSTGALDYMWMFGDGDSSNLKNPEHRFPHAGKFNVMLIAISNKGCKDTAYANIKILEQYTFYAPTGFSPNGDGVNDFFYIMAHSIKSEEFLLEVYDRWGEIIWKTNKFYPEIEKSEAWDGKVKDGKTAPVGTYTWRCVFRDSHFRLHEETGAITIIR